MGTFLFSNWKDKFFTLWIGSPLAGDFWHHGAYFEDVRDATGPFFLDAAYLEYNATTHNQPNLTESDQIASIRPEFFLPTHDKGLNFRVRCRNESVPYILTKPQQRMCKELMKRNFQNIPRPYSYTNHHWFHVTHMSDTWKNTTPKFNIKDLVPNVIFPVIWLYICLLQLMISVEKQ